ncbi:ChaB family protein [Phormidesmis sp. 146-33]
MDREAALSVAWNSIKQGFQRGEDGSWHRKEKPDDNVLSSGTESSAN